MPDTDRQVLVFWGGYSEAHAADAWPEEIQSEAEPAESASSRRRLTVGAIALGLVGLAMGAALSGRL